MGKIAMATTKTSSLLSIILSLIGVHYTPCILREMCKKLKPVRALVLIFVMSFYEHRVGKFHHNGRSVMRSVGVSHVDDHGVLGVCRDIDSKDGQKRVEHEKTITDNKIESSFVGGNILLTATKHSFISLSWVHYMPCILREKKENPC